VDVSGQLLTLDASLSWQDGQGVALAYTGEAPDVGAFELGLATGGSGQGGGAGSGGGTGASGATGTGGDAGAGATGGDSFGATGSFSDEDEGCGCRAAGGRPTNRLAWLVGATAGLLGVVRRRPSALAGHRALR
jgi:hypothetical protein